MRAMAEKAGLGVTAFLLGAVERGHGRAGSLAKQTRDTKRVPSILLKPDAAESRD